MGALTKGTPKPMLRASGAPLAAHALFFLRERGVSRAVINLHYLGAEIESGLAQTRGMSLAFSREHTILGTAGGIRNALQLIPDEYILVVNPDTILWPRLSYPIEELVDLLGDAKGLLFVAERRNTETGLRLAADGRLRFDENGPNYYAGCSLMRKSVFASMPAGERAELGPIWRELAQGDQLRGLPFTGEILDLGTAQSYMRNRDVAVPSHLMKSWKSFVEGSQ